MAVAGEVSEAVTGDYGMAVSQGKSSSGKNGLSVAKGYDVKVKGGFGAVLVIAEITDCDTLDVQDWKVAVVDGEKIKPNVWYCLQDGEFVEA